MRFLLDTDIISEIRKRDRAHPNVTRWVNRTPVEEIGTSVMVLAEIRRGIELKRPIRVKPDHSTGGSGRCEPASPIASCQSMNPLLKFGRDSAFPIPCHSSTDCWRPPQRCTASLL